MRFLKKLLRRLPTAVLDVLNVPVVASIMWLNNVKISLSALRKIRGVPFVHNNGTFEMGEILGVNSRYSANPIGGQGVCSFLIGKGGHLHIDDGVGISNSAIVCHREIYIGKGVLIGGDCKIYDTDFHSIVLRERLATPDPGVRTASVRIEDGAFIGTGSIILKGVVIEEGAVIAAGSVVTKRVPRHELWAGNPARFVKKISNDAA